MPSELDHAWAAGLVDGDGCITMVRSGKGTFGKPMVVVDNTDTEILAALIDLYGGSLVAKKRYQAHHRQAYSWRLYGSNNVRAFLATIYPHMRCAMKRERARMFLEEYGVVTPRNGWYSTEQRAAKIAFEDRFSLLGADRGSRAVTG